MFNKARVQEAFNAIHEAEEKLTKVLREEYPINSNPYYTHGRNLIYCRVIEHNDSRVFVRGFSGKDYWISGSRLR